LDTENTGFIDAQELSNAMQSSKLNLSGRDISNIMSEVDYMGNMKINYSEFLAATCATKSFLNEAKLMTLFRTFDTDGSNVITPDNLIEAFQNLGNPLTQKELDSILTKHDIAHDGIISFEEFKLMMIGEVGEDAF
jgi:Ca2+-binding EF-hand superfamily protein